MKVSVTILLLIISISVFSQSSFNKFFNDSDKFFKTYVVNGKVNYKYLKNHQKKLDNLYAQINSMDISDTDASTKKAFYINAYNLVVIYQVTKYYPLKSPLNQSGFFDKVRHKIAGESMTLNALEIKKLMLANKDARIHFALACAAVSCPKLASFAFRPSSLDKQLDSRTNLAINDDTFVRVDYNSKKILVSMIFKWYARDFTTKGNTVKSFINKYRTKKIPQSYSLGYYQYDWKLNGF